jgi:hypothetical protein
MTGRARALVDDLPLLPEEPDDLESEPDEPAEPSDLDYEEMPCTDDGDDSRWEAFIPDEDELDLEPEAGDFWIENRGDFMGGR